MYMSQGPGGMVMPIRGPDNSVTRQRLTPGTVRRILPYAKRYRIGLALLLLATVVDSIIIVTIPLLLREIIDKGIQQHDIPVIGTIAGITAGLALLDALMLYSQSYLSARIGQGVSYDLRVQVFGHVQRQPIAFFTRTQTGSLVSRLNTDIVGAQQAITTLLTSVVSSVLTLLLVLAEMFYLSWQVSVITLAIMPVFIIFGRVIGRRLQRYSREQMQLNGEMGATMNEYFNVSGAMLAKLYGRPQENEEKFARRAGLVRDIGVSLAVYGRLLFIMMALLAALITALVYGLGGALAANGAFQLGTLVALAALLSRLYAPINQLSSMQSNAMTALVGFDRIFEILDLKPLVDEKPRAVDLPPRSAGDVAPDVVFDQVSFRYPAASEVSLASLESIALPAAERTSSPEDVLRDVSFVAPSGKLTALVGRSGAGKTTITHLVSRLYDPRSGAVRIGQHDLRDVTLQSLSNTVGVVTQDAHLYHDTIRANLAYARPAATEQEMIEACQAAQIWNLIESLPSGLDTVVGDRGYRLSGGEKQRIAVARLLLKAPSVVILDEATAHLDSESEAAIQRALETALTGRTSLVIAHRLSTIREASQVLVIDAGEVKERGTHEELLALGGLYAELYHTQFAGQQANGGPAAAAPQADAFVFRGPPGEHSGQRFIRYPE